MASNFHIQKPYLLSTLPNPSARSGTTGKCVVGEVFGQRPDSRKRKRSELSIGIDGDAVNLYDVPASRLITSYPIPPQFFFTCSPCSLRWKSSSTKQIVRSTYISTQEGQNSKRRVSLFKDVIGGAGDTASTSTFQVLRLKEPIVYLTTIPSAQPATARTSHECTGPDLLAVSKDANILCLDGETLAEKWQTSASAFLQGLYPSTNADLRVDLAQISIATDVAAGLFDGKDGKHGAFNAFPQKLAVGGYDPDVLLLVTSAKPQSSSSSRERHLHVLVVAPESQSQPRNKQNIIPVASFVIPRSSASEAQSSFRLDVDSGHLEELCAGTLWTYRVVDDILKLAHTITVPAIASFIRLSESSVLATASSSLQVYNPEYRSLQSTTCIDLEDAPQEAPMHHKGGAAQWELVTYFRKLEIAVAFSGRSLIAVQLEAPKSRKRKRRTQGLLIDSIGRGLPEGTEAHKWSKAKLTSAALADYLPGSLTSSYWKAWERDAAKAEERLSAKDLAGFERVLAGKFKVGLSESQGQANDAASDAANDTRPGDAVSDLPEWQWPSESRFPQVDRRWVLYAIARVFSLQNGTEESASEAHLSLQLPQSNLVTYLVGAGHLSVSNLKSAFSEEREVEDVDALLGEQVPQLLAKVDPTLNLLFSYLHATKLGPFELLTSIRLIMRSLDLVQDPTKRTQKLLTGSDDDAIGMDIDRLEEDLEVTEHHLLDDSSTRARSMTVALGLLAACPVIDTVRAMQRLFRPDEILSLIHVLRVELVKGGWTTRYLDASDLDRDGESEAPPDGSIRLIADLLSRCIDSVGPGGWMVNDAILSRSSDGLDSTDFLGALKLEVSAALEGIQEAQYMRGILAEAVKYGLNVQQKVPATPTAQNKEGQNKPLVVRNSQSNMLPLGLGARSKMSLEKVVSGGEVVQRSRRERGYLGDQKIGTYTLERIVI